MEMNKKETSILAKVLGVEEDEEWRISKDTHENPTFGRYRIHEGKRQALLGKTWLNVNNEDDLSKLINHPECIIKFKNPPDLLTSEKIIIKSLQCKYISRDEEFPMNEKVRFWNEKPEKNIVGEYRGSNCGSFGELTAERFPSILPGQCFNVESIAQGY